MRYNRRTSESVSDGHPDKIADQISDAILDAVLRQDPKGRVACETLVKDHLVVISGEISAAANVDYLSTVISVLSAIYGYQVNANDIELMVHIGHQSKEIAAGVDHYADGRVGAGDQGMMYGYACDETKAFMPLSIYLAHQLMVKHREIRLLNKAICSDAKCQVTVEYQGGVPQRVSDVVFSTQHRAEVSLDALKTLVRKEILDQVLPEDLVDSETNYWLNPSGSFIRGGPSADCGLTGRKIIVDTYGGFAHHGGGAFSGKDATKVDRSAAYMARYVAKHIVAAKLARRCEVQLAYAIGVHDPVMIELSTFGTNTIDEVLILEKIKSIFDFSPEGMIETLGLDQPIFQRTAAFGHFGRSDVEFPWERLDNLDAFIG